MTAKEQPLVVVIEKDPALLRALSLMLQDWGFSSAGSANPEAAIASISGRSREVCAIVADADGQGVGFRMQDLSRLTRVLGRSVPTLIASRHASFTRGNERLIVVAKPFDPDVIREWLQRWTRRNRVI